MGLETITITPIGLQTAKWANVRRWLRCQYQPVWDNMWNHAEDHADAIGEANPRNPMFGALMGICLGQQKEIERLKEELETLLDHHGVHVYIVRRSRRRYG